MWVKGSYGYSWSSKQLHDHPRCYHSLQRSRQFQLLPFADSRGDLRCRRLQILANGALVGALHGPAKQAMHQSQLQTEFTWYQWYHIPMFRSKCNSSVCPNVPNNFCILRCAQLATQPQTWPFQLPKKLQDAANKPECIHVEPVVKQLIWTVYIFPLLPYQCTVDCGMRKSVECKVWSVECGV